MKFTIVIPALNEEDSVVSILERCIRAAQSVKAAGLGVTETEVLLVNDGSTDRTEALARGVPGATVLGFERNRGYGAAIQAGFEKGGGELLGFIDADGTCDPAFFVELIRLLRRDKLDVALGSRMHGGSRMPAVRRLGNRLFRALVNLLGSSKITDVASGMRVLRADAFLRLAPLPDGLDFTPAMSVRAVLDRRLRIGELPMPYEERVGRSKLSVVQDGLRFLGVILDTAITFRPLVFFGAGAAALAVLALAALVLPLGGPAAPISHYLEYARIEDWMIFRIILATMLLTISVFFAALGALSRSLVDVINRVKRPESDLVERLLTGRFLWWGATGLGASVWINRRVLAAWWETGRVPADYWVFALVGSLFAVAGAQLAAFSLAWRIARLLRERERFSGRS